MIYLWGYLIIGALLAWCSIAAVRSSQRAGNPEREAQSAIDRMGLPAIVAGIVLFWPVLAWMVWGKK